MSQRHKGVYQECLKDTKECTKSVSETQGSVPRVFQRTKEVFKECPRDSGVYQGCPRSVQESQGSVPRFTDTEESTKNVPGVY